MEPIPGRDVLLTLSLALQETLYAALSNRPGCALALSLPDGEVLAACSSPSFDPNLFVDGIEVTADTVYVGYGITAPELDIDEYAGVDVKGRIVVVEPEVPVTPNEGPDAFKQWRPYSFHDYKVKNARQHGAARCPHL